MSGFQSPIPGATVTEGWGRPRGYRGAGKWHEGLDFRAPEGTPVRAAAGGKVVTSKNALPNPAGEMISILHPDGTLTQYMHLSRRLASVDQHVTQGQLIAYSGATGIERSQPHLHFTLRGNAKVIQQYLARFRLPPPRLSDDGIVREFGTTQGGYVAIPAETFVPVTLDKQTLAEAKAVGLPLYTASNSLIILSFGLAAGLWYMSSRRAPQLPKLFG